MKNSRNCLRRAGKINDPALFGLSAALLAAAACVSLFLGAAKITPAALFANGDILLYIRVPRILAAVFAGAGLAGAGVVIQTLLGNSLAGPNIIGVNSGAGFMAIIAGLLFPLVPQLQPAAAFVGALIAVLAVYALARKTNASKMTILLTGVILNSLFNAGSEALCTFFPDANMGHAAFRVGGLSSVQTSVLYPAMILITAAAAYVLIRSDVLELLALGDETAFALGVPVKKYKLAFLLCAACMAGAAVSFAGLVGFLGLIIPHAARLFVGEETRRLFPLSLLWGALMMLVCDAIARTAFAPFELSVGIILSVVGAPVFIRMLLKRSR